MLQRTISLVSHLPAPASSCPQPPASLTPPALNLQASPAFHPPASQPVLTCSRRLVRFA